MTPDQEKTGRTVGRTAFFALRAVVTAAAVVCVSMWLGVTVWPGLALLYIISEASRR